MSDIVSQTLPSFSQNAALSRVVRRRRVFYLPGFDPTPSRRYRELYRKESAAQSEISGYEIDLKGMSADSEEFGWTVNAKIDGQEVDVDATVLVWSDIVKSSMGHGIVSTYFQMFLTAWIYTSSGALRRLMWLRKGPIIAALYPILFLVLQLLTAVIVGSIVGEILSRLIYPRAGWVTFFPIVIYILRWFRSKDNKIYAYYLTHNFAYTAQLRGAYHASLEERIVDFRRQIAQAMAEDYDEVLVVGHSSGAHLAVSILADLQRYEKLPKRRAALGLLTLGHVVPMASFLPKATRLRGDLKLLSTSNELTWIDVTAPGDGCSFSLCDPVAVSGVATDDSKWPLVISAAFTKSLSPERWQELRRRYFRLHFQYLCAFDRPKGFDYFQITAGPTTLAARYKDRAPSPSRLDIPVSKYTDT